jgi:arylsulfatase A-like enzyme
MKNIVLSLILMMPCLPAVSGVERSKPNIIYINADDLGWADLGCQGSTFYQTPHLDQLARDGMTFSNAYAPAANCAPSRACVMSGQVSPRHGVYTVGDSERGHTQDRKIIPTKNTTVLADGIVTMAEALKADGYATGHVGKWHLGDDPTTQGFDVNIAGFKGGSPSRGGYHSPYDFPNCKQEEKGEYLTDRLGMEAVKFIEVHKDRPFFLHLATHSVHTPIQAKADLIALYKKRTGSEAHNDPTYAAMIHSLDENVGRVLAKLDELGLAENTLVLFSSDNGGMWKISKQWPLRAGKGAYYEGGIREPLFVRWPGNIAAGSRCDVPVSGSDFYPTLLEAAGVAKTEGTLLDGVSLVPLLTQAGGIEDRALFWHFPIYLQGYGGGKVETRDPKFRTRPGSVVRKGKWKLHEYFEDGGLELYNLDADPGEKINLVDVMPAKAEELKEMLYAWRVEVNAPVPTELNPKYDPSYVPKDKKKAHSRKKAKS